MASTHKHIRSGTANKRPTTAIAEGQIALNTNTTSPGLYFKDSTGASIIKVGPVHVGSTAPNVTPPTGGSSGNSSGEVWLDTSLTPAGVKIWDGSAWVNATPIGSTTVQGLLELATSAETQAGSDTDRAVTPAGLQSKLSDSTSTTSSTTIASSTAVKAAYDLAAAALPKSGGTITGNLEIGTSGSLTFEGATADAFETTLAVVDPTADRTITLPNTTGTVVTTGDTGTVTSTMLLDGTVVDADINANAEIAVSKLADGAARQLLQTDAAGTGVEWASNIDIPGTLDVTSAATFDSSVAVTGALTKSGNNVVTVGDTGTVTSTMLLDGTILNADVNASAAIAGTKISPDFGSQTIVTTGVHSAAAGSAAAPSITFTGDLNTGIYSPGADQVAVATNGTGRLSIGSTGSVNINSTLYIDAPNTRVGIGTASPSEKFEVVGNINLPNANSFIKGGGHNVIQVDATKTYLYGGTGGVQFRTADNLSALVDITNAGLVGIGTASPSYSLDVQGSIGATLSSKTAEFNAAGGSIYASFNDGTKTWRAGVGIISAGLFTIRNNTDASNPVNITSAGLVGIGTSSPGTSLDVRGIISLGSSNVANAVIQKSAVPIGSYSLIITGGGGLTSESATTPTDALAGAVIKLTGGSPVTDDYGGGIGYYANGHTSPNAAGVGNQHVFYTRSAVNTYTERLRISAAGNVGIGSTVPQGKLESAAGDSTSYSIVANNSYSTGDQNYISLNASTTQIGSINRVTNDIAIKSNYDGIVFWTGTGGTAMQKAKIDSSGRLLIGTSSALTGNTGSYQSQYSKFVAVGNSAGSAMGFSALGYNAAGTGLANNTGIAVLNFTDNAAAQFASIMCETDAATSAGDYPGRLVFSTTADGSASPTPRMQIANNGVFTHFSDGVYNFRTAQAASGAAAGIDLTHTATGLGNGTLSFRVWTNGNVVNTNNSYGAISDIKLKENIVDATSQWLDIKSLQVRKYNFKEETGQQTHTQIGLVAQEVELVSPGLVNESPDRDAEGNDLGTVTKSVNYSVLYMKAVKALQEAMKRIETLEADVAQLKGA